jgi:hypothetical protein
LVEIMVSTVFIHKVRLVKVVHVDPQRTVTVQPTIRGMRNQIILDYHLALNLIIESNR